MLMTMTNTTAASVPDIQPALDATLEKIPSFPRDFAQHRQLLSDLKEDLVDLCAAKAASADIPKTSAGASHATCPIFPPMPSM